MKSAVCSAEGSCWVQQAHISEEDTTVMDKNPKLHFAVTSTDALIQLVAEAVAADRIRYTEDLRLFEEHQAEASHWLKRYQVFCAQIETAQQKCVAAANEGANLAYQLPIEVQSVHQEHQDRIEFVVHKMLAQAQLIKVQDVNRLDNLSPSLNSEDLRNLVQNESDVDAAKQMVQSIQEEVSAQAYAVVTAWSIFARNAQRGFISHIANTVVPILECLDTGEDSIRALNTRFAEDHPQKAEVIRNWCATYARCRQPVVEALKEVGIQQIDIPLGMLPDYRRHRVGAVVLCEQPDETIVGVERQGYELVLEGQTSFVIWEAYVVVATKREE